MRKRPKQELFKGQYNKTTRFSRYKPSGKIDDEFS